MLTLITGTPGAGKSLYAVWNFARPVPGSTVENAGQSVPRRLLSNIKDLLVEHEKIDADSLNNWQTWAKPGDVIIFDEVQEVWRSRAIGSKVPDCVAALETHRHMGVDLVLITQHPMLLDPNIRRLVNQHLHLRRITKTVAMVYEWDHADNPGNTRTCVASKVWMHPKPAYKLYKSAQLHTKPTVRVPFIVWFGLLAVAGLFFAAPNAWQRITGSMGGRLAEAKTADAKPASSAPAKRSVEGGAAGPSGAVRGGPGDDLARSPALAASAPATGFKPVVLSGCIATPKKCACLGSDGQPFPMAAEACQGNILGNSTPGQKADITHLGNDGPPVVDAGDLEVLAAMRGYRAASL